MDRKMQQRVNEQHKNDTWFYLRKNGRDYFKLLADLIVSHGFSVLDVGCGEALVLKHFPWTFRYVGIDLSDFIINRNRARWPRYFNNFHVMDMHKPDLSTQFDVILFAGVFTILPKKFILDLVRLYAGIFKPKFILIADIQKLDLTFLKEKFNVIKKENVHFDFIKNEVGVGTPEQINNRQILLIKV